MVRGGALADANVAESPVLAGSIPRGVLLRIRSGAGMQVNPPRSMPMTKAALGRRAAGEPAIPISRELTPCRPPPSIDSTRGRHDLRTVQTGAIVAPHPACSPPALNAILWLVTDANTRILATGAASVRSSPPCSPSHLRASPGVRSP